MWPVFLKYDGGSWNTTTNAWKEWQWNGAEPMNLRLAKDEIDGYIKLLLSLAFVMVNCLSFPIVVATVGVKVNL